MDEDFCGQPPSYTAGHWVRNKERCTEIEKDKSPEAKKTDLSQKSCLEKTSS